MIKKLFGGGKKDEVQEAPAEEVAAQEEVVETPSEEDVSKDASSEETEEVKTY